MNTPNVRIRSRSKLAAVAAPRNWPNGAECYMLVNEDLDTRTFTGWTISIPGGKYRCFSNEEGKPVHIGDFDEFYKGLITLSKTATRRSKKGSRRLRRIARFSHKVKTRTRSPV